MEINPALVLEKKLFGFLHYQSRRPARYGRHGNATKRDQSG